MSRSHKKTPIVAHTTCHSEKHDKSIWHKKWRVHERLKLATLNNDNLEDHCTTLREEVSNPWSMGKDGKCYFSYAKLSQVAEKVTQVRGRGIRESSLLKKRILYQWMGK